MSKNQTPPDRLDAEGSDAVKKKQAPAECSVVVLWRADGKTWAKGRSLEHAIANLPSYKATDSLRVFVVHCPAGCYIHPDSPDGYPDVWVGPDGRIRFPTKSTVTELTENPLQFRTVSKTSHGQG